MAHHEMLMLERKLLDLLTIISSIYAQLQYFFESTLEDKHFLTTRKNLLLVL